MRVLWFTNTPCNYQNYIGYGGGGWLTALQDELCKRKDIALGVSFCMDGQACKVEQAETVYYPVQYYRKSIQEKLLDIIHIKDYRRDECAWAYYINNFKKVIEDFKPDVIEVFGSELYIGLATIAAKQLSIPCCLHVQGILSLSIYIFLTPGMSKWSYYLSNGLKNIYTNMQYIAYWKRSCYREKNILKAVPHVIGRTEWDKKAMEMLAPQAKYHYGGEILRACFYNHSERKLPSRAVISTTISNATYKGYDLLLKIANILKNELYLEFEWNVYGNVNPQTAELITNIKHKDVNVNLYGVVLAEQLREHILGSTLYCHTSYIENSPNSVAEAQMLGIPVVAANVGGISSMVSPEENGFLFPATDPYMAAYYIKYLIENKDVNIELGKRANENSKARHDKQKIVTQLLETYNTIIK